MDPETLDVYSTRAAARVLAGNFWLVLQDCLVQEKGSA